MQKCPLNEPVFNSPVDVDDVAIKVVASHGGHGMPRAQYWAFQVDVDDRQNVLLAYHVVANV